MQRRASLFLICAGMVLLVPFVEGVLFNIYWEHEHVETYRGYDIHYFTTIGIYGIDTGEEAPADWQFAASVEACEGVIDNWLDDPVFVELYKGYEIHREPGGSERYYAVDPDTGEKVSAFWMELDGLKEWIDENLEPGPEPEPEPEPKSEWEVVWAFLQAYPWLGLGVSGSGAALYYSSRRRKR